MSSNPRTVSTHPAGVGLPATMTYRWRHLGEVGSANACVTHTDQRRHKAEVAAAAAAAAAAAYSLVY